VVEGVVVVVLLVVGDLVEVLLMVQALDREIHLQ
jgi:hypothetical protein